MNISQISPAYKNINFGNANKPKTTNPTKRPVNTQNNTGAKKTNKGSYQRKEDKKLTYLGIGAGGAAALLLTLTCCSPNSIKQPAKPIPETTEPSSYIETTEATIPTQEAATEATTPKTRTPIIERVITSRPSEERTITTHKVRNGERLTDLIIQYGELDNGLRYIEGALEPYFQIIEADNDPSKIYNSIPDRSLRRDAVIRIDGIFPQNRVETIIDHSKEEETPVETEPVVVAPKQDTTEEDSTTINGIEFHFDRGTMEKSTLEYRGLVFGKAVKVSKSLFGNDLTVTKYEGADFDGKVAQKDSYDKDGKLTKTVIYENGKAAEEYNYTYRPTSVLEEYTDKITYGLEISQINTIRNNKTDEVVSREFVNTKNKTVAFFDFEKGIATIGSKEYSFDGGLICNDDFIGSDRYIGSINGQTARIDVLKNGFAVYTTENGIESRDLFDAQGNLIAQERVS